jgi:hypothetical protein
LSITNWGLRGDNILSLTKTTDLRLRRANESNLQLPPAGNKISLGYIIFVQKALTRQINHEIGAETEYARGTSSFIYWGHETRKHVQKEVKRVFYFTCAPQLLMYILQMATAFKTLCVRGCSRL